MARRNEPRSYEPDPSLVGDERRRRVHDPDVDPEVLLSERLYQEYRDAQAAWAAEAVEDDAFRNGAQFEPEHVAALEARGESADPWNILAAKVEQAVAMLTDNEPRILATAREDSDAGVAALFSDIFSWIWYNSNGDDHLRAVVDDYYARGGRGVFYAYVDPHADFGRGEVFLTSLTNTSVYPDPNSEDRLWRDATHIIVSRPMSRERFLDLWPDYADKLAEVAPGVEDQTPRPSTYRPDGVRLAGEYQDVASEDAYEVIQRFTRVRLPYHDILDQTTGREEVLDEEEYEAFRAREAVVLVSQDGPTFLTQERDQAPYRALLEAGYDSFHFREGELQLTPGGVVPGEPEMVPGPELGVEGEVPGSTVMIEVRTFGELIDLGPEEGPFVANEVRLRRIKEVASVGRVKLYERVLPTEHYPVVPLQNRHNRNPYPLSDVRFVRGIQQHINKTQSKILAHAASATNVKVLVPRGSIVNREEFMAEFNRPGMGVAEYDPEFGQPHVVAPIPLPAELFHNQDRAISIIEAILGIYALQQGDASQSPETFRGLLALDEFGQRRIRRKVKDIDSTLTQLGRVIVDLVQDTYTEPKTIRLVEPGGVLREVAVNQDIYDSFGEFVGRVNDVSVGRYDVQVVSGSTLPSNRWARLQEYKELLQLGVIDQVEVLKKTDVPDHQAVLDRIGQIQQLTRMVEELQQQVKHLEGDLQTRERELFHAKMDAEVAKGKARIARTLDRLDASGEVFAQRLSDQLALQQKEASLALKEQQADRAPGTGAKPSSSK